MKRPTNLLQLFALALALCHFPVAAASAGYGFESAKAYLEARSRDMTDFQNRFENDLFQNLDDANAWCCSPHCQIIAQFNPFSPALDEFWDVRKIFCTCFF